MGRVAFSAVGAIRGFHGAWTSQPTFSSAKQHLTGAFYWNQQFTKYVWKLLTVRIFFSTSYLVYEGMSTTSINFNCHWRIPGANSEYFYRKTKDQHSEYYLLETCFLCGYQLSGIHSEEASFVKGLQKLYHSKRPLVEVSFYFLFLSVSLDQIKWEENKNSDVTSYQVVTVDVSIPNFA